MIFTARKFYEKKRKSYVKNDQKLFIKILEANTQTPSNYLPKFPSFIEANAEAEK